MDSLVRTFDRTIEVKVSVGQRLAGFVGNNWQWLWAVVVVPVGGLIVSRIRGRRNRPWDPGKLVG